MVISYGGCPICSQFLFNAKYSELSVDSFCGMVVYGAISKLEHKVWQIVLVWKNGLPTGPGTQTM